MSNILIRKKGNIKNNEIEKNKDLRKKFFKYLFPSVTAMWVFSLYTIVDGLFVGRGVGPSALAAVNISMPFINFIFAVSLLFSTGASTIIAIYIGRKDLNKANKVFTMTIVLTTILSFVIMIFSLLNLERIAVFLGATQLTMQYVKEYLGIIIIFNGFFMVSYFLEVIVKVDGFPQLAIIGVSISALMNILLDYIFIMKLHLGVSGAAYATGIAQVASSIFFLFHFFRKKSRLNFCKFKFKISTLKKIVTIGFPDCITELSAGIVIYLYNQQILKHIGEMGVVTYSIVSYVNTLVLMTIVGTTQGMQPLTSFYYGRKDDKTVRKLFKMSLITITIVSISSFFIVTIFAPTIVNIFIEGADNEILNYSIKALRIFAISFLLAGYNVNISGFFASVAKAASASIISLGRGLIIISLALFTLTALFGARGIWISSIVSEGICLIISLLILNKSSLECFSQKSSSTLEHLKLHPQNYKSKYETY